MDQGFCTSEREGKICLKRDTCNRYLWSLDKKNYSYLQSWVPVLFIQKISGISCDMYINVNEK